MSNVIIITGLQSGNEGKSRILDRLSNNAICIRATNGDTEVHTVTSNGKEIRLHILPKAIINPSNTCIIPSGSAIDLELLYKEILDLRKIGVEITPKNLIISPMANIIMPYHIEADALFYDSFRDKIDKIKRGIGPCLSDEANGLALKMYHLAKYRKTQQFMDAIIPSVKIYNALLKDSSSQYNSYYIAHDFLLKYNNFFSEFIRDEKRLLFDSLINEKKIVIEGFYQDSFNSASFYNSTAGVLAATGICPSNNFVYGVAKTYCSHFGSTPFITDDGNEVSKIIRDFGNEYCSTTSIPRRCGWLDLVQLKSTILSNGITGLCLNGLDTIGKVGKELGYIKVCTSYVDKEDNSIKYLPVDLEGYHPVYNAFYGGWDTSGCKKYDDLPQNAKDFIEFIEDFVAIPVKFIGIGPKPVDTILK